MSWIMITEDHNRRTCPAKLISTKCCIYASVNWVSIGSGNGLSPVRCQAITWTNAYLLSSGPLGTNFNEILITILTFSLKKCMWKCRLWNGGHFFQGEMSWGKDFNYLCQLTVMCWEMTENVNRLLCSFKTLMGLRPGGGGHSHKLPYGGVPLYRVDFERSFFIKFP